MRFKHIQYTDISGHQKVIDIIYNFIREWKFKIIVNRNTNI